MMSRMFRFEPPTMRVRIVIVISPSTPTFDEVPSPFTLVNPPVNEVANPLIVMYAPTVEPFPEFLHPESIS